MKGYVYSSVYVALMLALTGGPPYDGSAQNVVHPIALPIVIIYNTLASVGLLCAAGCTLFNIIFRNKK